MLLKSTVDDYEEKLNLFEEDVKGMQDLFEKELLVKDQIIGEQNAIKEAFMEKTRRLMLKLKIPRSHYHYLQKAGALEPFVTA